jgi:hypothetical protein
MIMLSKTVKFYDGDGIFGMSAAIAEICVKTDDDQLVYLSEEWTEEAGGDMVFCASNESFLALEEAIAEADDDDKVDELSAHRDQLFHVFSEGIFELYRGWEIELKEMISEILRRNGYDDPTEEDE